MTSVQISSVLCFDYAGSAYKKEFLDPEDKYLRHSDRAKNKYCIKKMIDFLFQGDSDDSATR